MKKLYQLKKKIEIVIFFDQQPGRYIRSAKYLLKKNEIILKKNTLNYLHIHHYVLEYIYKQSTTEIQMRYQSVEITTENGTIIAISSERKVAMEIINEKGLVPVQEMLCPLFDDECEPTGESVLVITVQ